MWFLVLVDAGSCISQFQCMLGGVVPFQGILGGDVSQLGYTGKSYLQTWLHLTLGLQYMNFEATQFSLLHSTLIVLKL